MKEKEKERERLEGVAMFLLKNFHRAVGRK